MKRPHFVSVIVILSLVFTYSCKKENDRESENDGNEIVAPYFFDGRIDGQEITIQSGFYEYHNSTQFEVKRTDGLFSRAEQTLFTTVFNTPQLGAVGFGLVVVMPDSFPTVESAPGIIQSTLENAFEKGVYDFGNAEEHKQGASVSYWGKSGYWQSEKGDQNESFFEIVDVQELDESDAYIRAIEVKFKCKLYNKEGESILIETSRSIGKVISRN